MNRILYVTSKVWDWYESQSSAEHFAHAPYSIDAIGYNLEQLGWTVGWMGRKSAKSIFSVARRIDEFRPDIVYTYGSTVALHPLICRKFLCKHKAFKIVHGWDDPYGRIWNEMFGWPGKVFMNWMEKRIVRNSDAVVTLSYELQKKGRRWGVDCHYIPNGADIPSIHPIEQSNNPNNRTILKGTFNLVYTGDKARWKRTEDICRAIQKLPKDIKLYMTGQEADYLKPYYSENCISLGWLTKEEQLAVMSQADAFVVTSNQDCNAKLQEYLRWHKPILAFDGEANNFFTNGRNALLAKDGDYAPLIERLAADPALCKVLADNAAHDIPVYTWAEIAQQFDSYFRKLLSYAHAQGTGNALHDGQPDDGCGLHPFASRRERALSDLSRVRVLAEALTSQPGGDSDSSPRDSLRKVIDAAKSCGLYFNPNKALKFGDLISKRTGESEVYFNAAEHAYYKVKWPSAKAHIKRTSPRDWFYEHIIHNILFPNTVYDLIGITEEVGELKFILRQQEVQSESFPSDTQIAAHLAALGLHPEDHYFFGNDLLAVTDVSAQSDNVLLDDTGNLRFIDPLIRLKKPAQEIITELVGNTIA